MSALIELADGCPAEYDGTRWKCPDRKTRIVLEYFTERMPVGYQPDRIAAVARFVVSMIAGSRVIQIDEQPQNLRPGMQY